MNSVVLTVFVLVTLTTIDLAQAVKGACKAVTPAENLDGEWMDKMAEEGWDCPLGSKVESNLDAGAAVPKDNQTLEHKRCYTSNVKTRLTPLALATECRFDTHNQQNCIVKTKGTPAEALLKFYGDFYYTLTDNKSFIVAYGCLMKNKQFWTGCVVKGQTMSDEIEEQILKHVKKVLKMSTDTKDMKSESDPIQIGFVEGGSCSNKKNQPISQADEAAGRALDSKGDETDAVGRRR